MIPSAGIRGVECRSAPTPQLSPPSGPLGVSLDRPIQSQTDEDEEDNELEDSQPEGRPWKGTTAST